MGIVWVTTSMLGITCMYTKIVTLRNIIIIGESFLTLAFKQGRHCFQGRGLNSKIYSMYKIVPFTTQLGFESIVLYPSNWASMY